MTFPPTPREYQIQYQLILENWVSYASIADISKYLIKLHNLYYHEIDEIQELQCGIWSQDGCGATCCQKCEQLVLAIMAIGLTKRPELKNIIYKSG